MVKRSLIVAINDYGHPANNLPSCVADAHAISDMLGTRFGFTETRQLFNKDATLDAVEDGLQWLFKDTTEDDRLVFYFSGHGYQLAKGSNVDEVLVLQENRFLPDDRLSELSQGVAPGTLTVILDSCFSGGADKLMIFSETKVEVGQPKRWTPVDPDLLAAETKNFKRVKSYRPFGCEPITSIKRKSFQLSSKGLLINPASPDEVADTRLNGLLLSACLETETASASISRTGGLSAFTFGVTKALGGLPATFSSRALMEAAASQLSALSFRQTPVIKEPASPRNLGGRGFLTFEEVAAKPAVSTQTISPTEIIESFFRLFLKQGEDAKMADTTMYGSSQSQDKGLLDLLPVIIGALSKGYQPGMTGYPGGQSQDKGLFDLLPVIIGALTKGYQPGAPTGVSSEQEKFLPLLIPILSAAVPAIVNAVSKDYQPSARMNGLSGQAEQEKFLGALIPVLTSALPVIIDAVSKGYQPGAIGYSSQSQDKGLFDLLPVIITALTKGYQPQVTGGMTQPMMH